MNKKKWFMIITAIVLALSVLFGTNYVLELNREKESDLTEHVQLVVEMDAGEMFNAYSSGGAAPGRGVLNTILIVTGDIKEIKTEGKETLLMLGEKDSDDNLVKVKFTDENEAVKVKDLTVGEEVSVQADFVDFTDIVNLNEASIYSNNDEVEDN